MEETDWKKIASDLADCLDSFLYYHDDPKERIDFFPNLSKVYHAIKNYQDAIYQDEVSSETVGEWEELY